METRRAAYGGVAARAHYGPMKMTAGAYYSEIGLGYLAFPVFAFGAARLARS